MVFPDRFRGRPTLLVLRLKYRRQQSLPKLQVTGVRSRAAMSKGHACEANVSSTEKLDAVLCCNRAEVNRWAARRTAGRCHRGDHLINERIEDSAGRRDHQLPAISGPRHLMLCGVPRGAKKMS